MTDTPSDMFAKAIVAEVYRGVIKAIRDMEPIALVYEYSGQQMISLIADNLEKAVEETTL